MEVAILLVSCDSCLLQLKLKVSFYRTLTNVTLGLHASFPRSNTWTSTWGSRHSYGVRRQIHVLRGQTLSVSFKKYVDLVNTIYRDLEQTRGLPELVSGVNERTHIQCPWTNVRCPWHFVLNIYAHYLTILYPQQLVWCRYTHCKTICPTPFHLAQKPNAASSHWICYGFKEVAPLSLLREIGFLPNITVLNNFTFTVSPICTFKLGKMSSR